MGVVNPTDWNATNGKLSRSALGQVAYIGELYDARTELFCSRSLFSKSFPSEYILKQDTSKSDIQYSYSDLLSERFNLLKIEAEVQLSVLLGLTTLSGSGQYLSEEKKSERTASCTLLYNVSTICEKLLASFNEIVSYIDKDAYHDDQYTHVVVEINWGANVTLNFELCSSDLNKKNEIEGKLKSLVAKLGPLLKPNVNGEGNYQDLDDFKNEKISLKFFADVLPDGELPTTPETAINFVRKLPDLLKSVNNGQGKPLNYVMIPLATFKKLSKFEEPITRIIKAIDESFVMSLIFFFEEINLLKRKINDLFCDFEKSEKYLPDDCLGQIRNMQQKININESKLKTEIAGDLPKVRNGDLALRDLIRKVEKYKYSDLSLRTLEEFIEVLEPVRTKLEQIKKYTQNNIRYLGKSDNIDLLMNENLDTNFYVLYTSATCEMDNPELFKKTQRLLFSLVKTQSPNNEYIVFDYDITKNAKIESQPKIVCYKKGIIVSRDLLKDHEIQSSINLAKLKTSHDIEYVSFKPAKRTILELVCPLSLLSVCSKEPLTWICSVCKDEIEYGIDDRYFYCSCGRAQYNLYVFKCSNPTHDLNDFSEFYDQTPLEKELRKLRPLKELNILILGQSGVGKSTWINSIVNYLHYDTLEDAKRGGAVCVIPASFTVTYKSVKKQLVEIGDPDSNESNVTGKSATQGPKTYNFLLSDRSVRLIDTPGLGDAEGIERDKENMKLILDHISHLREIHGICILMKSNETRIDAIFKFCIKELLSHLHKNAAMNILFCFTNSRSSFYSPGDTSVVLDKLLKDSKLDNMIALSNDTMFCLDNEAFRFLCTLKYKNLSFLETNTEIYKGSWEKSVMETKRLFDRIKELSPHSVLDTTTLCATRHRILTLTKPIAEITQTIQLNLAAIADEERKIKNYKGSLDELAKKLHMPNISLEPIKLDKPRTVCTNSNCVKHHKLEQTNVTLTEYVTHCHVECYLENIIPDTYPNAGLRQCWAMNGTTICRICKCGWEKHMHITYDQKRVETTVIDTAVEIEMKNKNLAKQKIEEHVQKLKAQTEKYKEEEKIIMQASLKFGVFLRENAIAPYNDGFKDYLRYLIDQEEKKVNKTQVDSDLLNNLRDMMSRYEEEVRILEKSMGDTNQYKNLTPCDVQELEKKLYRLELTGNDIKRNVEMAMSSNTTARSYCEKPLPIKNRRNKLFDEKDCDKKKVTRIQRLLKTIKNTLEFD